MDNSHAYTGIDDNKTTSPMTVNKSEVSRS